MKLQSPLRPALSAIALVLLVAAAAQAAPIGMNPNPVTFNGVNGTFTLSLTSGDTSNNTLVFGLQGSNPPGWAPASGVASLVFSGASVVSASELLDPDNMITGITLPGGNTVAGVLLDFGSPSLASFRVRLNGTPTGATLTSLGGSSLRKWYTKHTLTFQTTGLPGGGDGAPIPEPSAALCFAAGLILVGSRLRRP